MTSSDLIYRRLQEHLDGSAEGFPAVESGADIRLLKRLFTPEEVEIAISLSTLKALSAGTIQRHLKQKGIIYSISNLKAALSRMVRKGTILAIQEGFKETHYRNAGVSAGGIIDFQVNRLTPDLINDLDEYHKESFARPRTGSRKHLLPLRTIPVEKSIPLPERRLVAGYENARQLIMEAPGPLAVTNCICRQTADLKGHSCRYTALRETCLQIGADHARQYVEMGIARFITRDEACEILEKAQTAGLIIQPENSLKPEAICCCCGDCCAELTSVSHSPRPADLYCSNYYVVVDPALCNHCGKCIERCQLNARTLNNGIPAVDMDRCIGCGNCVVTCSGKATRLVGKSPAEVPPRNKDDMYRQMLAAKKQDSL